MSTTCKNEIKDLYSHHKLEKKNKEKVETFSFSSLCIFCEAGLLGLMFMVTISHISFFFFSSHFIKYAFFMVIILLPFMFVIQMLRLHNISFVCKSVFLNVSLSIQTPYLQSIRKEKKLLQGYLFKFFFLINYNQYFLIRLHPFCIDVITFAIILLFVIHIPFFTFILFANSVFVLPVFVCHS